MEEIPITREKLKELMQIAYRNGYADYEPIDAGLESYDPETKVNYLIYKYYELPKLNSFELKPTQRHD